MALLGWISNDFIDKELFAPFVVKKDLDYLSDLKRKYRLILKKAENSGADETSLKILQHDSKTICDALKAYYSGHISLAHTKIKNLVKSCIDHPLAVNTINESTAFLGTPGTEIQFFRARTNDNPNGYSAKEMLHLPLSLRVKTGNYRFSLPGIPSLYLGNSSYVCWLETGMPTEHTFHVSPVLLDGTQKILNLAVMTRSLWYLNDLEENTVHCWLKLLIMMIATSYTVEEEKRFFKSEYIISQSIMLACKELGLDGIAYFSKRVKDEIFGYAAINLALFAVYDKNNTYSDICRHLKIDDSYSYMMFKQLKSPNTYRDYPLRSISTGMITNIGNYKRQYGYSSTKFCDFDKFLFTSWDDKDLIPWGNALL